MREIEVKARLINKDGVVSKLESLGCVFEEPKTQHDMVYVEKVGDINTFSSNKIFLRIRKSNNKIIFTLKTNGENSLSKIEHEIEINSEGEMESILKLLKYLPAVTVNKKRITTHYKEFEICVDNVEDLGDFIEVERIMDEGSAEKIQDEMFEFLESLGVKKEDRVFEGYDILMLRKN
ncbi:MAG: putative Adenylyl cyclase CyaB [Candidatus Taylorbacteria bacterium]|nr:putative Adenylyl cyclase CyaB [Candidatus Taylorbacteria bacterium]